MQKIPKPQPFFRLTTNLSLFALSVTFWEESAPIGEMVEEVFDYEGTFSNGNTFRRVSWCYGYDWRFSEGVYFFELGWCMFVCLTVENLEFVGDFEFFEEP